MIISLLLILNVALESTVFQYIRIFGIKPDFVIIILVAYAIIRGSGYGAFIGLGAGLLMDILFGKTIGLNAITYMLTGYLIGQAHDNVFKDSVIPAILFNIAAVLLQQHLFFVFAYFSGNLQGQGAVYLYDLTRIILPQCLYNAILGGILYKYLYRLDELELMNKRIY